MRVGVREEITEKKIDEEEGEIGEKKNKEGHYSLFSTMGSYFAKRGSKTSLASSRKLHVKLKLKKQLH